MKCNKSKELKLGMKIEREHGGGVYNPKKIASDHIKEFSCYYSRGLIPMEKKLRSMK
jgi:hypothetical protein